MYFTLLFHNGNPAGHHILFTPQINKDYENPHPAEIYELVFHPNPVWFKGGQTDVPVCIPPHRGPRYVKGDLRCLLDNTEIERDRYVVIVEHGYNSKEELNHSEEDRNLLLSEIKSEGFIPRIPMWSDPTYLF